MKSPLDRFSRLMVVRTILSLVLVGLLFSLQSCRWLSRKNAKIDKPSPTGAYRVRFDSTIEDIDDWGGFHEWGNIQYLKGAEIVYSYDWDYKDRWEDTVMGTHANAAWLGNNVLYMGGDDPTSDNFMDEITISNTSLEHVDYVMLTSGKYTHITVFDLPPAGEIKVRLPFMKSWRQGERVTVSYSGWAARPKRGFVGTREATSPNDLARLSVEITPADFR